MINTAHSLEIKPYKGITYIVMLLLHMIVIFYRSAQNERIDFALSLKKQAITSLAIRLESKKYVEKKPLIKKQKTKKKLVKKSRTKREVKPIEKTIEKKQREVTTAKQEVTRNFKQSINNYTKPLYPRIARLRRMQGRVLLKIKVSHLGLPTKVLILKSTGHALLDKMAMKAAKQWRFLPITELSSSNHYWVEKPIEFKLK